MSSTDPGLGPKKTSTDPGIGDGSPSVQIEPPPRPQQVDSVEAVLDGFGKDRPDRARVKPLKESTPLPPHVRSSQKGVSTSPGQRQRTSQKRVIYIVLTIACVIAVVLLAWFAKPSGDGASTTLAPTPTPTLTPTTTPTLTPTPTLAATSVESLPIATTAATVTATARPTATGKPSAGPSATTPPPVPTTSASAVPGGPDPKNDVKRTM